MRKLTPLEIEWLLIEGRRCRPGGLLMDGLLMEGAPIGFGRKLKWEKDKKDYVLKCYDMWEKGSPDRKFELVSAFTPSGDYIGDEKTAKFLTKRGIRPELSASDHTVCSVGFCEKEQKWYGWSHRAICGFGVGDRIFEEEYGTDETPYVKHGKQVIKDMKDARLAAVRFADYVS